MVSNKLLVLVTVCLTLTSRSSATKVQPGQYQINRGFQSAWAITDSDLKAPFGFLHPDSVNRYDNYTVCVLVELLSDGKLTKHEVTQESREPNNEEFLEFKVRVLDGVGAQVGKVYDCLAPRVRPNPTGIKTNRFLLLGWMSKDKALEVSNQEPMFSSSQNTRKVKVQGETIYTGSLVPTGLKGILKRSGAASTALVNLARAIVAGADSMSLRTITSKWAFARPDTQYSIDGVRIYTWLANNISPVLSKSKLSTPAEQLRIGGLLADWLKPKGTMEYIKTLATVLGQLREKDWKTDVGSESLDKQFLRNLYLGYRMPSDEIFEIALSDSALYYLVLDRSLSKPSVETQRKMLSLLDVQDIDLRAGVYRTYANWYGMRDWVLSSGPTFNPTTGRDHIPNEAEMKNYWHEKLGGPIGP